MRKIWPRTLFGQLVVGTVLVQSCFLVLYVTYLVVSQRNIAEVRSRQRMGLQLDRLAAACSRELARGDAASLHGVLELSRIAPTIDVARVTDLQGKTLSVTANGERRELEPDEARLLAGPLQPLVFSIGNGQLEGMAPLPQHGRPQALLWLEPNHALSLNTAHAVLRVCLTYGLFALLTSVLPLFLIVRAMTRPLQRLRGATKRVVLHQDLDGEFPLPVTAQNEAGDLTASFNTMVQELSVQRSGLLETVAMLDSMLGNAPTGFAFFDRELRYVKLNECLAAMYGTTVNEHLGRRASEVYPGPVMQEVEAHLEKVFATGEAARDVELSGESPLEPERERQWLLHFYPVRLEGDTVQWAGVIVVDITERLQAEEALRRTEKLAAAGRLAASIAHEINNPLEAVTNLLYLLQMHDGLDAAANGYVLTAQAELARVSEITQQTLRFYRQSTSPALTDVGETLNSVVALHQPRITGAQIEVRRRLRGGASVFALSGELRQVFANLIGNAIDAMPLGGSLSLRVRPGCGRSVDGRWRPGVRVTVADTGMGMTAETRSRIFEAFFTTKQATGTGLGLWVSQEIVQKHSGVMAVRSWQGESSGTVFSVFLPEDGLRHGHGMERAEALV